MEITEVRVKLMVDSDDRLQGFCSVTFDDCFVVRDLKIIEGEQGIFIAMPSRKLSDRCPRCSMKNHLSAKFCNDCGSRLAVERVPRDATGRAKLHADIAHPINAESRDAMHRRILAAFNEEFERSKQPGYQPVEIYDSPDDYE